MNNRHSRNVALTVGTFDGVHLGHQSLLTTTKRIANERNLKSAAYTYNIPPKRYFTGDKPDLLLPPQKKISLLEDYVNEVLVHNFEEVKDLSPERFVEEILIKEFRVNAVVVGTDWRFGAGRSGTLAKLSALAKGRFTVHPKPQIKRYGKPISSTWIRQVIRKGDVQLAGDLLGRPPSIYGKVVRGDGIGEDIGFPTANLDVNDRIVVPADGSYAAKVQTLGETYPGVAYVGTKPTFSNSETQVEVHIIDFDNNIYGQDIGLSLIKYLYPSTKYRDRTELGKAIHGIVERAREILTNETSLDG